MTSHSEMRRIKRQRERGARKREGQAVQATVMACGAAEADLRLGETRQERKARQRAAERTRDE